MLPTLFHRSTVDGLLPRLFPRFQDWASQVDELFNDWLPAPGVATFPVDIRQEGQYWIVEAELPGLKKEDIDVQVENGVLRIEAKYQRENEEKREGYHLRERQRGHVSRMFRLPETVDPNNVEASLNDGVLTIRFNTRPEAQPRSIQIK